MIGRGVRPRAGFTRLAVRRNGRSAVRTAESEQLKVLTSARYDHCSRKCLLLKVLAPSSTVSTRDNRDPMRYTRVLTA